MKRKTILGDYQKPLSNKMKHEDWILALCAIGFIAFVIYAMHGDQSALNNGYIH